MSTYNAVLLRTKKGHRYVGAESGRRELYLQIDTDDVDMAIDLAERYLAAKNENEETYGIEGTVLNESQIPGAAYRLADTIGGERMTTYSVTTGTGATAVVTPGLTDPVNDELESIERTIRRLGGDKLKAEWAQPEVDPQETGSSTDQVPPPFSLQELVPSTSPPWRAIRPYWLAWIEVNLDEYGDTDTVVKVRRNGEILASCTMAPGIDHRLIRVNQGYKPRDSMTMQLTVAGRYAAKLAMVPRGTLI